MILTKAAFALKEYLFRNVFFLTELFSSTIPDLSWLFIYVINVYVPQPLIYTTV